jgi:hypothetical protein
MLGKRKSIDAFRSDLDLQCREKSLYKKQEKEGNLWYLNS